MNRARRRELLGDLLERFRSAKPGDSIGADCGCRFICWEKPGDIQAFKQVVYCPEHQL
jgi:hypothetical protein